MWVTGQYWRRWRERRGPSDPRGGADWDCKEVNFVVAAVVVVVGGYNGVTPLEGVVVVVVVVGGYDGGYTVGVINKGLKWCFFGHSSDCWAMSGKGTISSGHEE